MTQKLHVITHNIHKGFSHFNDRLMIHELRERLRQLHPDVVFLQEVQGHHSRHASKLHNWPSKPQHEFLAEDYWSDMAYGHNAVYKAGHHGNAILSRFPIVSSYNHDVSVYRFERRGLLHCEVAVPGWTEPLHCICVHLSLYSGGRHRQIAALSDLIEKLAPENAPLIIAGDFNDWRKAANKMLSEKFNLQEAFFCAHGKHARSFPCVFPLLELDRIYIRGFSISHTEIMYSGPWSKISDHAALSAHLIKTTASGDNPKT